MTKLLVAGMMAVFSCSVVKAQYSNALSGATLIYSNAFNGATVNITNTTINYSAAIYGGSNNPAWIDVLGGLDTNAYFANGTMGTLQGDSAILPFRPTSNQVYILTATVNFIGNPGSGAWVGAGFAQNYAHQASGNGRFTDAVTGYDWGIYTESSGALSFFAGPKTSVAGQSATVKPTTGTHTLTFVLDTTWFENPSNRWVVAGYLDGIQAGVNYTYSANPTIAALGLTETFLSSPNEFQWLSLTLSAAQLVIVQNPATANVNEGSSFTNTVVAAGTPPFFYQWYTNGVAIGNATNASLIINPVMPGNAGTNYYVVVTNTAYGAVTSTPAALNVNGPPTFATADPISYTNVMTLFGGTNNGVTTYAGSSPRFSVLATGLQPMSYFWQTNGVTVGGATGTTFSFPNTQWNSPTNFSCIASNSIATATNTWLVQYIAPPTAPYPVTVMSLGPVGYWRLNETDNDVNQYNNGEICNDYISGNNGIYTNTELAQTPGYNSVTDPTETAALFGPDGSPASCDANSIGTNVDFSGPSNAEFSVSVWANGGFQNGGTEPAPGGIVAKGYFNAEEFTLDDGASGGDARFEVRNAAGTAFNANSTVQLGGNNTWVHLVGVCDESNGVVNLYINGILEGSASIPPGSGVEPDSLIPIMIGARSTSATSYGDNQFKGALNDVALFNYALSGAQVAQLYGGIISAYLVPPFAATNIEYTPGTTVTIPAAAFGSPPIGYYWTNLTTDAVMQSGTTNLEVTLNATLTIPNISANLNSNQLELVVTNATGSTNYFVTLYTPPSGTSLDYSSPILYSNVFDLPPISIGGGAATMANSLVGGASATWICTYTNNANQCGTVYANGTLGTNAGCALVPFTPEPGYIYTMTASLTAASSMNDWVAMGFTQFATQTNNPGFARFTDSPVVGYGWMYVQNTAADFFGGPETAAGEGNISSVPMPGTVTMQLVLNTMTNGAWTESSYVNSTQVGATATYTTPPPIGFAGIGQNQLISGSAGIQWNYWSLTQVAPNGAPPYLFAPLPPTNVMLLPNQSLAISAKTFGSMPLGYNWIDLNTGDILASGSTGTVAPLDASLNVPSVPGDWNGNVLELAVTNAYGTNISLVKLSVISTNTAPILPVMNNGSIALTWPIDHMGWQLQAQTNSVSVGISNNWVNVAGTTATNVYVVPINLTNGTVFYRLKY
ncbi:MAG TPA: hypothetical protein VGJ73_05960 [Verrucomicrobiae bacterium]